MKIRLDIDCTPDEARAFFGLPDVKPMQARMMDMIQERIEKGLAGDPETLLKTWLPASAQGWEAMQKTFWAQAGMGDAKSKKKD